MGSIPGKPLRAAPNQRAADLLTALLISLPALALLGWVQQYRGAYFYSIYLVTALVFWSASLVLSSPPVRVRWFFAGWLRTALFFYLVLLVSWLTALVVLLMTSATPLCVGQDNGDGINNLALCLYQAFLVSVVYSYPVLLGSLLTAGAAGWLYHRLTSR